MAQAIRSKDWSQTSLGPLEQWSETLLGAVNHLLSAPFSFAIYWGEDLTLLYNDVYRPFLASKHPAALGANGHEVWSEAWPVIGPPIEMALREGKTTTAAEVFIPILKGDTLVERWWSYSLYPLYGRRGIAGVANPVSDNTDLMLKNREVQATIELEKFFSTLSQAQSRLTSPRKIMEAAAEALGRRLQVDRVGYSEARADLETIEFETGWVQGSLKKLSGQVKVSAYGNITADAFRKGDTVVYADVRLHPELGDIHSYESIGAIAVIAVPLIRGGSWRGSLYVNHPEPRNWTAAEIAIVEDVARRTTEAVEQAKTEEALRQTQQHLQLAMTAAGLGMWSYDTRDGIMVADPTMHQIFGSPKDGVVDYWLSLLHPDDRERVGRHFAGALAGENPYDLEYRIRREDDIRWIRSVGQVMGAKGLHQRMFAIIEDITDRKRNEQILMQTEKLAAVGRLASSIAHEINNPLEAVTNLLYLAKNTDSIVEVQQWLDTADSELRRVSAIVNQTLQFHRQSTKPVEISCIDLISNILSVYESRLHNSNISVEKRKRAERPVRCFEGEIRQVLGNLIVNAIDAMSIGGRLLMRSREGHDWRTGRLGLIITTADTGSGIPAQVISKIFEAFYTTKDLGGSGLGLWISKDIIERHAGRLLVRSSQKPGHTGTIFTLFLPFDSAQRT